MHLLNYWRRKLYAPLEYPLINLRAGSMPGAHHIIERDIGRGVTCSAQRAPFTGSYLVHICRVAGARCGVHKMTLAARFAIPRVTSALGISTRHHNAPAPAAMQAVGISNKRFTIVAPAWAMWRKVPPFGAACVDFFPVRCPILAGVTEPGIGAEIHLGRVPAVRV